MSGIPASSADRPSPRTALLVVAAGRGTRAARHAVAMPKQYVPIGGRPVLAETLATLSAHPRISRTIVVIHPDDMESYHAASHGIAGLDEPVTGGATRQLSVLAGLERLADDPPDMVLIHDGVRPFCPPEVIERVIDSLSNHDGAIAALPVADTMKRVDAVERIVETVPRAGLWAAQTPQGFRFEPILTAHRRAHASRRFDLTDDAAVAEWAGLRVAVVPGDAENVKITTAADLDRADHKLAAAHLAALADVRIGNGFDVHRFGPGDSVVLGGVRIDHDAGLVGHSDADVALHAITDAILGAIGDGDIGQHFPPSEERWRGADSAVFLADAVARVTARGGIVGNIDLTIVCERPKIGPHREAMRARIAEICGMVIDRIGVKATTSEGLGFTGRREGIVAMASAVVRLPWTGHQPGATL
ncbi:bifunctional 2-C-methyl-D-erythritol 4-phosphate cytidylyltransferase/2-C-methyl-D-erythritol 2,4-cyclodiphosphate synthase [Segnochrobactrum spirostomi]|uniref:Bifunctional enzyme IspD/IspF n=1 Tax=Segnochrobactrum spirostomi TaxID=2608987 RepID=A0A6A7Y5R4_9HYPH|nr:bifunctional 2-C-methyl-D-erythritol 4-phosphate cytidylyltransferase/2-C-methyl-D-erythritol 2,4-cyclodiphosphate synthase [Segnochrobactrum spirostomi]MQT14045.1 bifunctional 2-C-methyl-D-erythritol 4-phosphate cytidylyltransferase/2-C-methyl-D-erythritol 2,4-cyclodiphosphate synthase [Segnochrobactrum spirostomi]